MSAFADKSLRFPEARVHVRALGDGPPLLLINGLGGHTGMWEPLERELEGFRIVEFDLPGAGRSDVPWRPVSIKRLARLAAGVMTKFGMDNADVLGFSMGGVVAQQLAADMPERVRRLLLIATTPGMGAMQGNTKALLNIMTPLRYMSPATYTKTVGTLVGGRARRDDQWIAEQTELRFSRPPSWRGYLGQMASMAVWTGLPLLPTIPHPTLVMTGDDDPLTPVVNAKLITHLLPNGRLQVLPGQGHLMVLDEQSSANETIRQFLTAEKLETSTVWKQATTVTDAELKDALSQVGFQLPPWSLVNAVARRRWLAPNGQSA
jgi:pimeloyl-ACP methyl ester carboxylesterase